VVIPTNFVGIIILFDEAFKYGNGATFSDHVATEGEPFCVQLYILVSYLTFATNKGW
jgi:hypothetical protein